MAMSARIKGNDHAPIKVTEFIDFQCFACAYGAAYLKEMIKKHPEAIQVEVKHFPLQMHRHGLSSSRYAECSARQGGFWPFQDMLLARQGNWMRLVDADPAFLQIADDSGLDEKKLEACLKDYTVDEAIEKNKEEGKVLGIKSTPTYFINGKMVVGGKSLEEEIKKLLEENGY
ncbi:MAG: thioredoxin domain-containing protein [Candidatus Omnitrophica bacterium]|nr:thioredoxin domain-containing protein [Candidatus Omnitrophota bacterium]